MNRKEKIAAVADIILPISAIAAYWYFFHEGFDAVLLGFVAETFFLVVQLYLRQEKTPEEQTPSAGVFLKNVNAISKERSPLMQALLVSKLEGMSKEISPTYISCDGNEIEEKASLLLPHVKKSVLATYHKDYTKQWKTKTKYFEDWRAAAQGPVKKTFGIFPNKRDFVRYFLCDRSALLNPSLLCQMSEDERGKIQTYIVLSEDVKERAAFRDFGIWDDELVCIVEPQIEADAKAGKDTDIGCKYTSDSAELQRAKDDWKTLSKYAVSSRVCLENESPIPITDEMKELMETAPKMEEWSQDCNGTLLGGGTFCDWYHQAWQYLRLLDMVPTPDWHDDFFQDRLGSIFTENPHAKVLICGAADYGMLRQVVVAAQAVRGQPDITVLDACQTPLRACDWYADRHSLRNFHRVNEDIRGTSLAKSSFDVIVTDAFLTRIPVVQTSAVVAEWAILLNQAGKIVTTVRIDGNTPRRWKPSPQEIEDFCKRAWDLSIQRSALVFPKLAYEEIVGLARSYASEISSHPFASLDELTKLLHKFRITYSNVVPTRGEFQATNYAQIVAEGS